MNENEQLARWLGFKFEPLPNGYKVPGLWRAGENGLLPDLPDFRTSNEWAGALLEQLSAYRIELDGGEKGWACRLNTGTKNLSLTWRNAVVDAALTVIKQSDSAEGSR